MKITFYKNRKKWLEGCVSRERSNVIQIFGGGEIVYE